MAFKHVTMDKAGAENAGQKFTNGGVMIGGGVQEMGG